MSRQKVLLVLSSIALLSFSIIASSCQTKDIRVPVARAEQAEPLPTPPINREAITIAAGGDIMLGSTFPNETRMPPNDGADLLKAVTPLFQAADIAFANLEGPMVDSGISTKCPPTSTRCFAFRVPTRYGKYLKEAGFDVLSLANNHAGDFGDNGRASTRKVLDGLGIKHAGSDRAQYASTILDIKGKRVAFVAFAHNNISLNVNELDAARRVVTDLAKRADIVVVSFHGGAEGAANVRVPQQTEIFFGEKRGNLPLFARTVIDAGADLVLGHGPHVLRGMEIYKDRLIAYSLGNFATYGWFQLAGATAETMVLEVKIDVDGKFMSGKINPFHLEGKGILTPDSTKSAISTVRSLSQMDFPSTMPKIADDGTISVR
jgi:poly-gamma-glutamate capsule biosynthesis protein CapA/YwtB (metallophosphatase superfamily)